MDLGFGGEVAEFYQRYRRGYPPAVFDALADALTPDDTVIDLGCGTGQLTLPIAARVRAVVGVDPEPDMLVLARRAARAQQVDNISWLLGADVDVPALGALLGGGTVGAVTIGQALHWMDHDTLLPRLAPLFRKGGGVAVVTNGTPLWLQETAWSGALRAVLEQWRGVELTRTCGTDAASQRRYRDSLVAAGYEVDQTTVDYTDEMTFDELVGGVYSTFSVDDLPAPEQRSELTERIRRALHPETRFREDIRVTVLVGRIR
ncbi:methyltransferase domain-containing protein [Micromonospora sp. NPDC051296]|uniref:class I SAM-dependent methyltransferase n=1 Tax=Micromonospora sp. NPDC051296 TaxID=3155046 RepID=UPI00342F5D62